jgi:hypothetical protein
MQHTKTYPLPTRVQVRPRERAHGAEVRAADVAQIAVHVIQTEVPVKTHRHD